LGSRTHLLSLHCKCRMLPSLHEIDSGRVRMHLQRASPKVAFAGVILLDPALLPPPFPSTTALTNMFGKFAASKRDKWPSRADARKDLARHPSFKNWDARALDLFVVRCSLSNSENLSIMLLAGTCAARFQGRSCYSGLFQTAGVGKCVDCQ
jgi:hypothetical protein